MIVYRTQGVSITSGESLTRIASIFQGCCDTSFRDHQKIVELVIEYGEFEAGVADAICPERDSVASPLSHLRDLALAIGRCLYLSWEGKPGKILPFANDISSSLCRLSHYPIPDTIEVKVPEGYAYYGLYPETYIEAARRFYHEIQPHSAVCIGIRSIGTSLSSVVGATLGELGCKVSAYTVRPHGHPFDRHLFLSGDFEDELLDRAGSHFLIIDEGPGLSGSSLCCTAEKLSEMGIPDDRILFFPSWEPAGTGFVSERARTRWGRHRKYTASFEDVWIESGRLAASFPVPELTDISAGMWRRLLYRDAGEWPAVHPHHERRKYLCSAGSLPACLGHSPQPQTFSSHRATVQSRVYLAKFCGLGKYGRFSHARAAMLAEAGFSPPVTGLENGFLISEFVPGSPITGGGGDMIFLDLIAQYTSFLRNHFPARWGTSFDELTEMVRVNVLEGLGEEWLLRLERSSLLESERVSEPVAVDGRMLPHEWIRVRGGYLKTDTAQHCDDHFFPGGQDIAWDIAGCQVEFGLLREQSRYLVQTHCHLTNDPTLPERLPFHQIAYLAYRLGYTSLAAGTLGATDDGRRFQLLAGRYKRLLEQGIRRHSD